MFRFKQKRLIVSFIIFIFLGILVFDSDKAILFDIGVLNWIRENVTNKVFSFMRFISFLGSGRFLFPAMAIIISAFLIKKRYYQSLLLLLSSLGSGLANYLLKLVFQRTRPLDYFLVQQGGLSYPSGHTMVATTMFLTFAYLYSKGKSQAKKKYAYTISIIYILLMGLSRVSLGVHWPTDIIGGILAGYVFYSLVILKTPKKL